MIEIGFVKGIGIWYERELNTIKKKGCFIFTAHI